MLAANHNADVLIMGAFGCGAFGNDPVVVAKAFETAAEMFANDFAVIEYAIFHTDEESPNYRAFTKIEDVVIEK